MNYKELEQDFTNVYRTQGDTITSIVREAEKYITYLEKKEDFLRSLEDFFQALETSGKTETKEEILSDLFKLFEKEDANA